MREDSILDVRYWLDYWKTDNTKHADIKLKCKEPSYKAEQNIVLNFVRSGGSYTVPLLLESGQCVSLIIVRN
jgi:hypothetical protein